jgi:hypothetical protein
MRSLSGGAIIIAVCLAVSAAVAQLPTATILGTVKDASGAVVPGTKITARSVETGQSRTTTSGADGSYRLTALPVGGYEVRAEQSGFQTAVQNGLTLAISQEAVLNFTLEVGAVEQTVAVTAEAPLVNTTGGSLGGLVDEQKVADLPLNGRNYANLTLLQTGVQQSNLNRSTTGGPQTAGLWYSSNGAPPRSNNYLLDGAIMQTSNETGTAGASQLALGIDGIREWRVVTNSFTADYWMTMGSQVVIVSKGGTNAFHGSVSEYLRNSALDARNFFDYSTTASPRRLPAFTRNNFGGSFGGPIKKDRTFFFGVYEALRERKGITTVLNSIPATARVNGAQIAPVIVPLLSLYPIPNLPNSQYTYPFSQPTDDNYGQMRVDHNFSSNDSIFARYTIDDAQQTIPLLFPEFKEIRGTRFQYTTLSENHIFSPSLLNTARVSYSRTVVGASSPSGIVGPQYSFVPGREIGGITIGGVSAFGPGGTDPSVSRQNIFTWSDDLFYTHGRHSLKFGTLINHYQYYKQSGTGSLGSLSFGNIQSFLSAQPNSISAVTPGSILDRSYHWNTLGFYAQDDMRVTSTLTLNLGLRYEFNTTWNESRGDGAALRDVLHDASGTLGAPFLNPSLHNFSPRFGFAWDVTGNGKTAVRGGFGLLYDISNVQPVLSAAEVATPPFSSQSSLTNPPALVLPLVFPASAASKSVRMLDYHVQQPHMLQYNLTVDRQLPYDMALTVAYAGSRGLNILIEEEGNPTVPTILSNGQPFWTSSNPRLNPNWSTIEFHTAAGDSWYNSLQVGLLKRLSKGLQFQSSFTWSKSLDLTQVQNSADSNTNAAGPAYPQNLRLDRAPSNFDATLNWRFNTIYHLPDPISSGGVLASLLNGWWTTGILSLQSGYPYDPRVQGNISLSNDTAGAGTGFDRPNLVPGRNTGNISSGTTAGCPGVMAGQRLGTPNLWYDPCAFTLQSPGFLGNAAPNMIRGPGVANLDFSLVKDTALRFLGESGKLEFRAELFNILNHPILGDPNMTLFAGKTGGEAPLNTAGVITATAATSRQIQLALKLLF